MFAQGRDRSNGTLQATHASLGLTRSSQEVGRMDACVGDRIVVESEQAAQSGRAGVIEEVLADDPPRYGSTLSDAANSSGDIPERWLKRA